MGCWHASGKLIRLIRIRRQQLLLGLFASWTRKTDGACREVPNGASASRLAITVHDIWMPCCSPRMLWAIAEQGSVCRSKLQPRHSRGIPRRFALITVLGTHAAQGACAAALGFLHQTFTDLLERAEDLHASLQVVRSVLP